MPPLIEENNQQLTSEEQPENSSETQDQGEESTSENPTSSSQADGQGSEPEAFNHPLLKGKSPAEIERLISALDETVKSQNSELNRYHSQLQARQQETAQPSAQPEEADPYGNNFLSPHLHKLEGRLKAELQEMIRPLRDGVVISQAQRDRETLRSELPHFAQLEANIDQILRQRGYDPSKAERQELETIYYMAVGYATSKGISLSTQPSAPTPTSQPTSTPTNRDTPMSIPQRRPSTAPLPEAQKPTRRKLTEEERRLATLYGMTEEQYIEEQDKPVDEIVTPGFSKENW